MPSEHERWPNFFLIGAAKAGTTSLHRYLDEHPAIQMSSEKEAHFFTRTWEETEGDPEAVEAATKAYLALWPDAGEAQIRGESTPGYLWWPNVPERIGSRCPDARFAVSLRDPIQRAYSDHLMHVREGKTGRSFLERVQGELDELDTIEPGEPGLLVHGLYHTHLQRYVDRFGADRLHVILFEELKQDPLAVLEGLARFLDVSPDAMDQVDYETVHNPYGEPINELARWAKNNPVTIGLARALLPERLRIYLGEHLLVKKRTKPPMDAEARDLLADVYGPEIDRLEAMLDRDLDPLRASWAADA